MDAAILYADVAISGVLALLLALLAGIRALAGILGNLKANFSSLITGMLWEESEEVVNGKKTTIARPSKMLTEAVSAFAPILITEALKWAEKNVKVGDGKAPGSGGLDISKMIPGRLGKNPLVQMLAPALIQRFLPGLLGGGAVGGAPAGGGPSMRPFA